MCMSKDFEVVLGDEELKADHKWYGKEDRTPESSIHDKGKGEPIVLRHFEYKLRPDLETPPTRDQLLTPEYVYAIKNQLWGDGLRVVLPPRVHIGKDKCDIFFPCQATTGNSFIEEPKLLQEWI